MGKIKLTLTEEQASVVANACEFYARVRIGQFNEIILATMSGDVSLDNFCRRRDEAERLLLEARKQLYPDLHGIGHSYGIGKFKDADQAFDVHQVLSYALGSKKEPWSNYPLPKCEKGK